VLRPSRSHQEFQRFIIEQLEVHYFKDGQQGTVLLYQLDAKIWISDLSSIGDILAHRYSKRGSSARDPVDLFRSLLLLELTHFKSVDEWVKTMRAFPIWAIYSGFSPYDIPGVGTFYDFMNRLWGTDSPHTSQPHELLQKIFKECFVMSSANQGLLGDTSNLGIAGDGSSVRTGATGAIATLMPPGAGIATVKNITMDAGFMPLPLPTVHMTYPFTLIFLRLNVMTVLLLSLHSLT